MLLVVGDESKKLKIWSGMKMVQEIDIIAQPTSIEVIKGDGDTVRGGPRRGEEEGGPPAPPPPSAPRRRPLTLRKRAAALPTRGTDALFLPSPPRRRGSRRSR